MSDVTGSEMKKRVDTFGADDVIGTKLHVGVTMYWYRLRASFVISSTRPYQITPRCVIRLLRGSLFCQKMVAIHLILSTLFLSTLALSMSNVKPKDVLKFTFSQQCVKIHLYLAHQKLLLYLYQKLYLFSMYTYVIFFKKILNIKINIKILKLH